MEYIKLEEGSFWAEHDTPESLELPEDVYNKIQEAWIKYSAQPINFGKDPDPIAERDAFFAGAIAMYNLNIPF